MHFMTLMSKVPDSIFPPISPYTDVKLSLFPTETVVRLLSCNVITQASGFQFMNHFFCMPKQKKNKTKQNKRITRTSFIRQVGVGETPAANHREFLLVYY